MKDLVEKPGIIYPVQGLVPSAMAKELPQTDIQRIELYSSAAEALEILSIRALDVFVCDAIMPGLSG